MRVPRGIASVQEHLPRGKFIYRLTRQQITSAAIYDSTGQMVRKLWTMQSDAAGNHDYLWDHRDDSGATVPPLSNYRFIVSSAGTYHNVGSLGTSAEKADYKNHVPPTVSSVAVNPNGLVVRGCIYDEGAAVVQVMNPQGSVVGFDYGRITNETPSGGVLALTADATYGYAVVGEYTNRISFVAGAQHIERFLLSDSTLLDVPFTATQRHIQIYAQPLSSLIPPNFVSDSQIPNFPVPALVVYGSTLMVVDNYGNRILIYDKSNGSLLRQFPVTSPTAIAVDESRGRIWIAHENTLVSEYSESGSVVAQTVTAGYSQIRALAFNLSTQTLMVADGNLGQIKGYSVSSQGVSQLVSSFGQLAQPGDGAPDHFYRLVNFALDPTNGSLITAQTEPMYGARTAKFASDGQLVFEQTGLEFMGSAVALPSDPTILFSTTFHRYSMDWSTSQARYLGNTMHKLNLSTPLAAGGVPRILHFGQKDFFYSPSGDGVSVYRIDGTVLHLVSVLGGVFQPNGTRDYYKKWNWLDSLGTGFVATGEVQFFNNLISSLPVLGNNRGVGTEVTPEGDVVFATAFNDGRIFRVPLRGLDSLSNPVYNWNDIQLFIGPDTSPVKFKPMQVRKAFDGYYSFGWSLADPNPNAPDLWTAGDYLAKYSLDGKLLWIFKLPEVMNGMDVLPSISKGNGADGFLIGGLKSSIIYHYTNGGMLLGSVKYGSAMGNLNSWFDELGSVTAVPETQPGVYHALAEDDLFSRLGNYVIDLSKTETVEGTVE